jgi:hypothetical protein
MNREIASALSVNVIIAKVLILPRTHATAALMRNITSSTGAVFQPFLSEDARQYWSLVFNIGSIGTKPQMKRAA